MSGLELLRTPLELVEVGEPVEKAVLAADDAAPLGHQVTERSLERPGKLVTAARKRLDHLVAGSRDRAVVADVGA